MSSCKAAPACRTKKNRNPDETPRVDLRHRRRHAYVIGIRQHGRIRPESGAECLHRRCAKAPRASVSRVARHAQRYDAARQFLHHRRDAPSMAVSADLARYPSWRQRHCRAGGRSVVLPFAGDQFFWAHQMKRLGVAGDPVSTRKLERDKLKQAISFAQRAEIMPRASARGKSMAQENGTATAVAEIETLLRR